MDSCKKSCILTVVTSVISLYKTGERYKIVKHTEGPYWTHFSAIPPFKGLIVRWSYMTWYKAINPECYFLKVSQPLKRPKFFSLTPFCSFGQAEKRPLCTHYCLRPNPMLKTYYFSYFPT